MNTRRKEHVPQLHRPWSSEVRTFGSSRAAWKLRLCLLAQQESNQFEALWVRSESQIDPKKKHQQRNDAFPVGWRGACSSHEKGTACHTPDLGPHWVTGEFWGHWWKCSCGFTFFIGPSARSLTVSLGDQWTNSLKQGLSHFHPVILKESQKHHFIKFCSELRLQRFLDRLWMSLTDLLDHGGPHGRSLAPSTQVNVVVQWPESPSRAESSCGWRGWQWSSVT